MATESEAVLAIAAEGEVEDGYILTCQSVPTSSSIKVSFDD